MRPIRLNCYAMKKENIYVAGCLTLNLIVYGDDIIDAIEKLKQLIYEYIETICKDKEYNEFSHLLNRPAPFFMYKDFIKCFIFYYLNTAKEFLTFNEIPVKCNYAH